ncbi:DNA cytosine methyltransferase [Sphingomonas sp. 3-13AW]|uniref:DNA cytosine methyltransferase n=1 Tax=Sphingomonas sp. 3-13AW TaxID=3050450 RepID=UPI003BB53B96
MQTYSIQKLGQQRYSRRLWLEGRRLEKAGFSPNGRYDIQIDREARSLTLRATRTGGRIVTRKERDGRVFPIIDISSGAALSPFEGLDRVLVVYENGALVITPLATDERVQERLDRLAGRLDRGEPLRVGSLSTGVGVLSLAVHEGLEEAGLDAEAAFVCDLDGGYLAQCEASNPMFGEKTVVVSAPLQEIAFDHRRVERLPEIEILEAGIPCTAHSNAGRAKKGNPIPEDDPMVGHLAVGFLAIVATLNPAVVLVENVPGYMTSASFSIIRNQLTEWGYEVRADVLKGSEFNTLEHRDRMALVAVTRGMDYDVSDVTRPEPKTLRLGDVLDDVANDDPTWSDMRYLKEKEERDMAEGKGFQMQVFGPDSTRVSTIGRGYAKVRSTEPKLRHPTDPTLLRQLTPAEHARCKAIPEDLVHGMPMTRAHEVLGQSVLMPPFRAVGAAVGRSILNWHEARQEPDEFRLVA